MPPIGAEEAVVAYIGIDRLWLRGGFPDSLTTETDDDSYVWRQAFIRSDLERDVPMFAPRMPTAMIGRLWTMLANGQGNTLNSARLAQGLGLSAPMIGRHIDLLVDRMLKCGAIYWIQRGRALSHHLEVTKRLFLARGRHRHSGHGHLKARARRHR
jgi:predicted AAA+ superfamily ATPase